MTTDGGTPQGATQAQGKHWWTPGVLGVAGASFGSDAGHEMTTSLLPTFLTSVLHAGPGALGVIEGTSDALVGLSKLAGGPLATDPHRRSRIASGGYLVTALATGAIALTTAVWQVAILRGLSWAARGLRTPARDALLVSLVPRGSYGRASGLERAGDNAGAVVGPLLAATLVGLIGIRYTMALAVIPGLFAAASITLAAREARRSLTAPAGRLVLRLNLAELRRAGLGRTMVRIAPFEIGNAATTLLILRATGVLEEGRSATAATSLAILGYAAHNAAATVAALYGGRLIDRANPRLVFAGGAACYVAAYSMFAAGAGGWPAVLVAFLLAGVGIGLAEPAETTMVALALPDQLRGNGFGVLGLVQSFGDLGASLVAGLIWALVSPTAAFAYLTFWMVVAVVMSLRRRRGRMVPIPSGTGQPEPQ
jgi:MFS family permease